MLTRHLLPRICLVGSLTLGLAACGELPEGEGEDIELSQLQGLDVPADYKDEQIRGAHATLNVTILEVRQKDVPELDDCATFLRKAIEGIGPRRFREPFRFEDASWVGFRLCEILPLKNPVKQKLLELTDAGARLEVLHRFLKQQKLID